MTHTIGYYDHIEHDAVTAASLIRNMRKLLEMQMQHINDLNRRLAESIRRETELRERIAELEAGKPPVPYAITPKPTLSCRDCRYRDHADYCRTCGPRRENHKCVSYAIPRFGCTCGACEAARARGEVEL